MRYPSAPHHREPIQPLSVTSCLPAQASKQVLQFGLSSPLPLPEEYLPAKATLERIVQTANLSSRAFTTCPVPTAKNQPVPNCPTQLYQAWETDSIIASELWRNLALALAAVGTVSLLMLGQARYNIQPFNTMEQTWHGQTVSPLPCCPTSG